MWFHSAGDKLNKQQNSEGVVWDSPKNKYN
jgi:hypothetical protein